MADFWPNWANASSAATYFTTAAAITYTANDTTFPVPIAPPKPEPETALDWLRGRVEDVCAFAAA